MFDITIILYEYTEILLGKRKNYSDNFFDHSDEENEQNAIEFIRIVAKAFLRCRSIEAARNTINPTVLKTMQLDKIAAFIQVPKNVYILDRTAYMTDRIFTDNFNAEQWIADHLCMRITSGDLSKFPKHYMRNETGMKRAIYCLRYFLTLEMPSKTIPELYAFAITPEFRAFLKRHLLLNTCMRIFDSPLEFLHETLDEQYQNTALYELYRGVCELEDGRKICLRGKS